MYSLVLLTPSSITSKYTLRGRKKEIRRSRLFVLPLKFLGFILEREFVLEVVLEFLLEFCGEPDLEFDFEFELELDFEFNFESEFE